MTWDVLAAAGKCPTAGTSVAYLPLCQQLQKMDLDILLALVSSCTCQPTILPSNLPLCRLGHDAAKSIPVYRHARDH